MKRTLAALLAAALSLSEQPVRDAAKSRSPKHMQGHFLIKSSFLIQV